MPTMACGFSERPWIPAPRLFGSHQGRFDQKPTVTVGPYSLFWTIQIHRCLKYLEIWELKIHLRNAWDKHVAKSDPSFCEVGGPMTWGIPRHLWVAQGRTACRTIWTPDFRRASASAQNQRVAFENWPRCKKSWMISGGFLEWIPEISRNHRFRFQY